MKYIVIDFRDVIPAWNYSMIIILPIVPTERDIRVDKTSYMSQLFLTQKSYIFPQALTTYPCLQVYLRMPRPPPAEMPESMRKRLEAEEAAKSKWTST